jgi:hypothetical protein
MNYTHKVGRVVARPYGSYFSSVGLFDETVKKQLTPWSGDLLEKLNSTLRYSRNPTPFMELEGSLPCSQEPALMVVT